MDINLIAGIVMLALLVASLIVIYQRKPGKSQRARTDDFE